MKIAMINASPKTGESASRTLLGMLGGKLSCETETVELHKPSLTNDQLATLSECDAWVFAFPVYIDAIPSHLLGCMCQLEEQMKNRDIRVYAIANCGFYEGRQTVPALAIMKNWCARSGFEWSMGVGFGGGGGLEFMQGVPVGKGPLSSLGKLLDPLSRAISQGRGGESLTCSIDFPRFLYTIGAEGSWKKQCKANGLEPKDLDCQL